MPAIAARACIAAVLILPLIAGCSASKKAHASAAPTSPPPSTAVASTSAPAPSVPASSAPTAVPVAPAGRTGPPGGPVPGGFQPYSATFVSAHTGWVLGNAPCSSPPCTSIVRTEDGGVTWRGIPAPKSAIGTRYSNGTASAVDSLRFADAVDGWVSGGALFATHDGGGTWHAVAIGSKGSVVTGLETAGGAVYATVDRCAPTAASCAPNTVTVYSAPIGSDTWTPISAAVSAPALGNLVAHDTTWYLPTTKGILTGSSAKQGRTLPNPCPAANGFASTATIAVADSAHLDAVCISDGAAGSARYQLYGSVDGGLHWTASGPSHIEASGLSGLADNARRVLLMATSSGASQILRTTNDGTTFTNARINAPSGGLEWADLGFTTPTQAIVVLLKTAFYLSRDAGATWSAIRFS
ncbi:hypothetical protein SAMN05444157_0216 [Frankineae bacterium MT45]|nr:hypothetical protein SAMN05444157_0216 [Frankineae bacterium MT45]